MSADLFSDMSWWSDGTSPPFSYYSGPPPFLQANGDPFTYTGPATQIGDGFRVIYPMTGYTPNAPSSGDAVTITGLGDGQTHTIHGDAAVDETYRIAADGATPTIQIAYQACMYGPRIELGTADPYVPPAPPPAPASCDEIGSVTIARVSAHYRQRVHDVRLMSSEARCLIADFNGVTSAARTIERVIWRCDGPLVAQMSNARIRDDASASAVDLVAGLPGEAFLRCEARLDNGAVYVQPFHVAVAADPLFVGTVVAGPEILTAPDDATEPVVPSEVQPEILAIYTGSQDQAHPLRKFAPNGTEDTTFKVRAVGFASATGMVCSDAGLPDGNVVCSGFLNVARLGDGSDGDVTQWPLWVVDPTGLVVAYKAADDTHRLASNVSYQNALWYDADTDSIVFNVDGRAVLRLSRDLQVLAYNADVHEQALGGKTGGDVIVGRVCLVATTLAVDAAQLTLPAGSQYYPTVPFAGMRALGVTYGNSYPLVAKGGALVTGWTGFLGTSSVMQFADESLAATDDWLYFPYLDNWTNIAVAAYRIGRIDADGVVDAEFSRSNAMVPAGRVWSATPNVPALQRLGNRIFVGSRADPSTNDWTLTCTDLDGVPIAGFTPITSAYNAFAVDYRVKP